MTSIGTPLRAFFESEVERLLDRLYGTALRLTRNRADAEDLVADTLAKAWVKLPELRDRQAFEKWVFRILVNGFISERRKRQARPREVTAATTCGEDTFSLFEKVHQPFLLWWGNPEQELLDKLLREDIESAVEELPEEFRLVVVMIELWGLSYAETANTLDIPIGTVRSRLSRGRSLLQGALWRQAGEAGIAPGNAKGDAR
ncbi:sigma-70 family RNA polymerase sigma factor [Chelativorans salis]|uniref:Sigma-70 family RNA polymerase sigma factor n=1 Tax=Chelativorans salis TaxID=2978478 RepID=A0ABT2LJ71_9HYPH|nr:sigma-70 family RNA polymerase sigma factor [Chelativorans sp. EGI FJ00035]MCT7373738.1 sigma-70 family RNA polymerase sigma factor [Chelativorans sp. EGI FJ00035]